MSFMHITVNWLSSPLRWIAMMILILNWTSETKRLYHSHLGELDTNSNPVNSRKNIKMFAKIQRSVAVFTEFYTCSNSLILSSERLSRKDDCIFIFSEVRQSLIVMEYIHIDI